MLILLSLPLLLLTISTDSFFAKSTPNAHNLKRAKGRWLQLIDPSLALPWRCILKLTFFENTINHLLPRLLFAKIIQEHEIRSILPLTRISRRAKDDNLSALWFFLRNPAKMGSDSAKMGLRLILSSELAMRIRALTAVKRVISFLNLEKDSQD